MTIVKMVLLLGIYCSCTIPLTAIVGVTNEVINVFAWDARQEIVRRMSTVVRK